MRLINIKIFDAVTVAAGESAESDSLDLRLHGVDGFFSLQVQLTGDGTATISYLLSNDNENWVTPTVADDITTGLTKASGPGGDGKDMFSFSPMVARYLKIKVEETGAANSVAITAIVGMQ